LPLRGIEEQTVLRRQPRLDRISRNAECIAENSIHECANLPDS
jgi:hypothetical protein